MGDMADDFSPGRMCAPECEHENRELRHHSNQHNAPFCMRYWKCKDCGEFLGAEDFSIGCHQKEEANQ
jgi:hypothetical protein